MKHPARHPKHPTAKGTVRGQYCNTTRCANLDANWFNHQTYSYYCQPCAHAINGFSPRHPICDEVHHDLTLDEMNQRNAASITALGRVAGSLHAPTNGERSNMSVAWRPRACRQQRRA